MSYPIQSLAIIAPILFILLIIAIPVIGVFAGWKRAAYWGGGTFVFFIIGLIIWKTAGVSIGGKLTSLLSSMLPKGTTVSPELMQSIAGPVFFMCVMLIAEIILVINYYAWFKRVSKIKTDIQAKKAIKEAKKAGKSAPKSAIPSSAWGKIEFTTKGKIINMVSGGVGLGLLMAPTTITFTQGVYYLTTNTATRQNNGFSKGVYSLLQNTEKSFSWFSYYNGTAGIDCNSMMSVLGMYTSKIEYTTLNDDGAREASKTGSGVDAFANIMSSCIKAIMIQSIKPQEETGKHEQITTTINNFADVWNDMMNKQGVSLAAIFESQRVTDLIQQIFEQQTKGKETSLNNETIDLAFDPDESEFIKVYNEYIAEGSTMHHSDAINVNEEAFDAMVNALNTCFKLEDSVDETHKATYANGLRVIAQLMFMIAE